MREGETLDMLGASLVAYADPPYAGCAHLYREHSDYAGEVDQRALLQRLYREFDGFIYHLSAPSIPLIADLVRPSTRWCAWVKPFAAFKANVPLSYAWEPVLVQACRKPKVHQQIRPLRDWLAESITLQKGLTGVKPERVCWWLFEAAGMTVDDALSDLFPGTGAVTGHWHSWRYAQTETVAGAE